MSGIFYSSGADATELRPLWEDAFGADRGSLSCLSGAVRSADRIYTARETDGRLGGFFFSFSLQTQGQKGFYIYGLCTRRDLRGRGIMRELIRHGADSEAARGASFALLIPANEALRETYRKMGFSLPVPVGAAADPKAAEDYYGTLEGTFPTLPFDGDFERLWSLSGGVLSREAFRFALATLSDTTDLQYLTRDGQTPQGYLLGYAGKRGHLWATSPSLAPLVKGRRHEALAMPLSGACPLLTYGLEPLPR